VQPGVIRVPMNPPFRQMEQLEALRAATAKPLIGMMGPIGAGKSQVAACFERLGCGVVDADAINRELLGRQDVQTEILQAFGPAVAAADGRLDRRRLTDLVFADGTGLRRLTDLLHPRIARRMVERVAGLDRDPAVVAIVLDAPLLAEVGLDRICDALVYVHADERRRLERLQASRGWDSAEAARREKFLFSLDTKRRMADHTVDNSHSLQACAQQVGRVLTRILQKAGT
jgi:dephospho-CoA kinase